ncbi:MAG TPA: NAD(+)/NADH kinase, partial [Geminicoccaceae bacterium]|nr:NAD(+)/NADH kinase [Geminicoccaceae bacterium]
MKGETPRPHSPILGLIVNPVAGLGGAVALKGSDGAAVQAAALAKGAVPRAGEKAARALLALRERLSDVEVLAFGGGMGDPSATQIGEPAEPSSGLDTRRAAVALRDAGAALLLVVGGDGTVRDVLAAVGDAVPILGAPAGVKMQSAVFATSPRHAGEVAAAFLGGDRRVRLMAREVMDIDEAALRAGRLGARLHGFATVPVVEGLVQNPKAGQGPGEAAALAGLCAAIAAEMIPGRLYVLGPGTTKQQVLEAFGLEGTLLGVDAVLDGKLVGRDLDATALETLVDGRPATLVVSGACWGGADGLVALDPSRFPDDNLVWSFHSYAPFILTHQGAGWTGDISPYATGLPYPPYGANARETAAALKAIRARVRAEA